MPRTSKEKIVTHSISLPAEMEREISAEAERNSDTFSRTLRCAWVYYKKHFIDKQKGE